MEEDLRWVSNAFHFLIQRLGHSFVPPPHLISGERTKEIDVSKRAGGDIDGVTDQIADCQLPDITEAEKEFVKIDNPASDQTDNEDASSQDVIVIGAMDEHTPHNRTRMTRASQRHKHSKQLGSLRFADHLE